MAYDGRNGRHRLRTSTQSPLWGTFLRSSDDFGKIWTNPLTADIRFPADSGASLKNIWQFCPGRPVVPDVLDCGVDSAALLVSRVAGETSSRWPALVDSPYRPR